MKIPNFKTLRAIIKVGEGRKALAKWFESRPTRGRCPEDLQIPIVIMGYIDDQFSSLDGDATEFLVTIEDFHRLGVLEKKPEISFEDFICLFDMAPAVFVLSGSLGDYIEIPKDSFRRFLDKIRSDKRTESVSPIYGVDHDGNLYVE